MRRKHPFGHLLRGRERRGVSGSRLRQRTVLRNRTRSQNQGGDADRRGHQQGGDHDRRTDGGRQPTRRTVERRRGGPTQTTPGGPRKRNGGHGYQQRSPRGCRRNRHGRDAGRRRKSDQPAGVHQRRSPLHGRKMEGTDRFRQEKFQTGQDSEQKTRTIREESDAGAGKGGSLAERSTSGRRRALPALPGRNGAPGRADLSPVHRSRQRRVHGRETKTEGGAHQTGSAEEL
mmetsp:Transcript_35574/g.82630  ORF Transcript_35574/g.82630 Transcript_35574/m.82630 type:complete len:231 (+) Transcript_35574:631-1323(+)